MTDELKQLRKKIDAIDSQLLKLLNQRATHAIAIGELKKWQNPYRPDREAQILRRIGKANFGPLKLSAVMHLFREVMSACLALERPLIIAYLGPTGTFSESAALKHFGHAVIPEPCASVDEAFHKVEVGSADYAVVPVENSTEGAVGRTLDLLVQTSLKIGGEVMLPIHHNLMSKSGKRGNIKRIYSHPQSFAQCYEWLNQNLSGIERIPVSSNAEAAQRASKDNQAAAIAGELAAERYSLKIVAQNIEDASDNTTRFLVLGKQDAGPTGKDKTSLVISAKNRPGALYDLLVPLADHKINMTKLESRPSHVGMWEYMFFVDIEGHREDKQVAPVLTKLGKRAAFMNILGSYPLATF